MRKEKKTKKSKKKKKKKRSEINYNDEEEKFSNWRAQN